jgi:hypothetical protein
MPGPAWEVASLGELAAAALEAAGLAGKGKARPPLGVYNTSVSQVANRLRRLLNTLEARPVGLRAPAASDRHASSVWEDDLLERTDAFLDSVMEHFDDAETILGAISAPSPVRKQYDQDVKRYRDLIGTVVNHIKHHQNRLRLVEAEQGGRILTGYYVEAPQAGGTTVGPSTVVHPSNGAFSYNRDLRLNAVGLVGVSAALARAVESVSGATLAVGGAYEPSNELRRVAQLDRLAFRDEAAKPWPAVIDLGTGKFRVTGDSADEEPDQFSGSFGLYVSMRGDGVTRAFRVPYGYVPSTLSVWTGRGGTGAPNTPPPGMSPQRIAFDLDVASLNGPQRQRHSREARSIQQRFRAGIPTQPAFEVAAAIFGAIATALEESGPRTTHELEFTYVGGDSTTLMLRAEAQGAMRDLGDDWWSGVADAIHDGAT